MNVGEGMVAMVRGLGDRSLAVTLLDGTRKFTLMPNNAQFSNPTHNQILNGQEQTRERVESASPSEPTRCEMPARCKSTARCESGAQATDGRYASMYKTAHCHVSPTSPAVELTEFPPQRADVCHGHDNFEVGGTGSGDTYSPTRAGNNFRGGMSWTDRGYISGSVYDPRPSHVPDAFANSLRKYPNISPERSTEMVERLISYSQSKNGKNNTRSQTSPSRASDASSSRMQKCSECETNCRTRKEESPTRESRSRKCDFDCADFRRAVFRNYDVRFFREVSKRTRDSARNLPMQNTNSVNMETQAVVEMTSKEVATVPGTHPSKRSVAVPLSPATSTVKRNNKEALLKTTMQSPFNDLKQCREESYEDSCNNRNDCKRFKAVQTSHSTVHFQGTYEYRNDLRRGHSQENTQKNSKAALIQDDVVQWWELYRDRDRITKWEERLKRLAEKMKEPDGEEKLRMKIEKYLKKVPSYFSDYDDDSKDFRETLPDIIIQKIKKEYLDNDKEYQSNSVIPKYENLKTTCYFKAIIKRWLEELNIDKTFIIDDILEFIVHKVEPLILGKTDFGVEFRYILKSNLIDILNEIPILIDDRDKDLLNRVTDDIIEDLLKKNSKKRSKNVGVNCIIGPQSLRHSKQNITDFIIEQMTQFLEKNKLCISIQRKIYLEKELVNIVINAFNSLTLDINKEDISIVLQSVGELSEQQAKNFTNKLIDDLNDSLCKIHNRDHNEDKIPKFSPNMSYSNSFRMRHNIRNELNKISKDKILCKNVDLDIHDKKLEDEIMKWLQKKNILLFEDTEFINTVVKDLTKNISRNNALIQSVESIEYEVLKWFRKLLGDSITRHISIHDLVEKLTRVTDYFPGQFCLSVVCQNAEVAPEPVTQRQLSYVEELIDIIFDWYHELPYDLIGSLDSSLDSHLIKELAERIYTRILSKEDPSDVIDNEIDTWYTIFLKTSPDINLINDLKSKIKHVTFREKLKIVDKHTLKKYEDSIGDWLDTLKRDPAREDIFIESKNMLTKELAIKLYEIKRTQGELSDNFIRKKMRQEISEWLIKVPINPILNTSARRNVLAKKLMSRIKDFKVPIEHIEKTITEIEESLNECDVFDWLKAQSFYTKNNASDKLKQETYITELANVLNEIKNGRTFDIDTELVKCVKKLDINQEYDDEFIHQTVANLKTFLQNVFDLINREDENKDLTEIIKQWLNSLPLNISSERERNMVECFLKELLDIIKHAKIETDSRDKDQFLEAVEKIIKVLPIECKTKCNEKFLSHYSKSLLQQLNRVGKMELKINENIVDNNLTVDNTKISSLRNQSGIQDLNENNYIKQLTEQIEEWLTNLQMPVHEEKGLRAVVINELAKDIIDREKYLQMNPSSRGTTIEEIDHLKFQIFKWINKLVGEENLKTVEHAPELMQRIRSIRDPQTNIVGNIVVNTRQSVGAGPSSYPKSKPTNFDLSQMPIFGLPGLGGSVAEGLRKRPDDKRFSNPLGYPVDYTPKTYINNRLDISADNIQNYENAPNMEAKPNNPSFRILSKPLIHLQPESDEPFQLLVPEVAEGTTVEQIYEEYDEVFKQRSNEIPLEVSTPEEQTVANYIRRGIINIIWNTYFKAKSNPEIEDDYKYVEIVMEEALDEIFDDLPVTAAIQKVKQTWKIKVVQDVITMLIKVHSITDSSNFKALQHSTGNRLIAKVIKRRTAENILNYFVFNTANIYLLARKYNEQDPIKTNIYKLRLMKYIENLVRRVEFYNITNEMLHRVRQKVLFALNNVPEPDTDILPSELNELEIGVVIENWFKQLPGIIPQRESVEEIWSRLRQLLARKINTLETRIYEDEFELDRLIMHEASLFLETPGMLCGDNDLYINEMIEELAKRLRERRQDQVLPQYTSFVQYKPLCSSIIQVNPNVDPLPTSGAPMEQCPVNVLTNITPPISSNVTCQDAHLNLPVVEPSQPLTVANVVQAPSIIQADLNNVPNQMHQVLLNNVGQVVQPEIVTSIREQMKVNMVNNSRQLMQQEFIVEGAQSNRIKTNTIEHTSQVGVPHSSIQVMKTSNFANIPTPVQDGENQNLQHTRQAAFNSPKHGLSYMQVNNFPEPNFVGQPSAHNIPAKYIPPTGLPVNDIPGRVPQTELGTGQIARSTQELYSSSRPTSEHRTRSTVRVGDIADNMIEERVSKRARCTCAERRCRRRKYVCSCDDDDVDDAEDVLFIPCKYYS